MDPQNIPFVLTVCFFVSLISALILRHIARKTDLVDVPNDRKKHAGHVPLVGGISIFMGVGAAFLFFPNLGSEITALVIASILIIEIGILDDQIDLKVRFRLSMQFIASLIIIFGGDIRIETLGMIGSEGSFHLGSFSLPFTIFSFMVAMNAFNFIDGIDGLSGLLFMNTMLAIIIMCILENGISINNYLIPLVFLVAVIPYMAFNLGLLGKNYRVFLGDSGSMLLGLTVAWLLINYTQGTTSKTFSPVTALWIIAIPLMDMLTIVTRRVRNGKSPFHPDRSHLHHLFMDKGMSERRTLIVIGFLAIIFASVGILTEHYEVSHFIMLAAYILIFFAYYRLKSHFEIQLPEQL